MLSPKRVGPEQVLSPISEPSRDFALARFTADVGPAQVGLPWGYNQFGVGVVYEAPGFTGATWRILLPDGTFTTYDSVGTHDARHASCSMRGGAFVYEDRAEVGAPPGHPLYGDRIMLRLGGSPFSALTPTAPHHVMLDGGSFFDDEDLEKPWDFTPQGHVFAPTTCSVPGDGTLALWNRGSYDVHTGSRKSVIRGCVVSADHQAHQPIETFDFEWTSHSSDRFNANLHAFECSINFETDGQESWMQTVGLVNSNANGLINIRVFDMGSGRFDPARIYSSEWSPAPGLDPAGTSDGGHPIVAWIGRDDGDVHVVIAQPRARLSGGIGSVFAYGTAIVANRPVPKGHLGNRRPSLTSIGAIPGEGPLVVVSWEAPRPEGMEAGMYRDIKARVFDWRGQPRTDEFIVSGIHRAGRAAPHVVPSDRGFYAIWMDNTGPLVAGQQPGLGPWCIKGQRWAFDVI